MEQHYFKTAEFAALCGVKKDTLLHYDHIGLLKPQKVGGNGYRYYTIRQLAEYDLIAALRRLGTPLAEIRDYFPRRSPETFLALLREKQQALEEEQRRLARMGAFLETTLHRGELAQRVQPGEVRIEQRPRAYCAVIPAPDFERFEESVYLLHIRNLLTWARKNGTMSQAPGDIICRESLERGSFLEDYYYCRVPEGTTGWDIRIREEGTYAVLYHQGPYETEAEACRYLRDWVWDHGYEIDGDLYGDDLVNYAATDDPDSYLMRLSLKIKEA